MNRLVAVMSAGLVLGAVPAVYAAAVPHVETFDSPEWATTEWMKFSVDMPLDNKPLPGVQIRSYYDWTKGQPAESWPNLNWTEFPIMMVAASGEDSPSYEEYYLTPDPNDANQLGVRWESLDYITYTPTDGSIIISVLDSSGAELFNSGVIDSGPFGDAVGHVDFGDLPYDPNSMTLRIQDSDPNVVHHVYGGYWAVDNLTWSIDVSELQCGWLGTPSIPADLNGDCYVNWGDFSVFASYWLACDHPNDPNCTPPQ